MLYKVRFVGAKGWVRRAPGTNLATGRESVGTRHLTVNQNRNTGTERAPML